MERKLKTSVGRLLSVESGPMYTYYRFSSLSHYKIVAIRPVGRNLSPVRLNPVPSYVEVKKMYVFTIDTR